MTINVENIKKDFAKKAEEFQSEVASWYEEQIAIEQSVMAPKEGKSDANIWNIAPAIDSFRVMETSLFVQQRFGFELSTDLIKQGGYADIDEMMKDLLPKIESIYIDLATNPGKKLKEEAVSA